MKEERSYYSSISFLSFFLLILSDGESGWPGFAFRVFFPLSSSEGVSFPPPFFFMVIYLLVWPLLDMPPGREERISTAPGIAEVYITYI